MASFDNPIHKQKTLECAQHFELKFHFKSRLILIQQLDEEDLKSMYTTYIMCSFLSTIRFHVCDS